MTSRSRGTGMTFRPAIAIIALLTSCVAGVVATATRASAAPATCSFATPGSGAYAETLCWLDMSGYDAAVATSPGGQLMTVDLLSGYKLTFTLSVTGSTVQPAALPTYSAAFLGQGGYTGLTGDPALYQTESGTTTATETNITLTDPHGNVVTDYSLVGADAESTDAGESIGWTSAPGPLTSLAPLGNACSGGFTGVGTTSVTCTGSAAVNGIKTGSAIVASTAPTTFTQTMHGTGLQAFGFGVLVAGVELSKTVVNGFSGDSFGITAEDGSGTVIGSANTAGGTSASTGIIGLITSSSAEHFRLSETATSGTLADYDGSWTCTRNGAPDPSLPSGNAGASNTVTLGVGDLVACTVTNTAKPVSLLLVKHAGTPNDVNDDGLVDAGDTIPYTFVVTNTGRIAVDGVGVKDPKVGPVSCPAAANLLAPGDQVICTATYTITKADVSNGSVDNTATASGSVAGTASTTVTSPPSSTTTPTTAAAPALTLIKTVSPTSVTAAGQRVVYSFLVTNTGNVPVTGISVDEVSFSGTGAAPIATCPSAAETLAPGASVTCSAPYSVTQADIDAGSVANTATASGEDPPDGLVTSPPSSAKVRVSAASRLGLRKSGHAVDVNHDGVADAGDRVEWTLTATNLGATTITHLAVNDPSGGSVSCARTTLAPGASTPCSVAPHAVTAEDVSRGSVVNTATATGIAMPTGAVRSNRARAVVDVHAPPPPPLPADPPKLPGLPFTGFAAVAALKTGAVAFVLGVLLMFVAELRRRSV
jgi:uncharacterized repeat protein (TIGR01451 family)